MKRGILYIALLLLVCPTLAAQTSESPVTLEGRADIYYKGKTVVVTRYQDYMSFELQELGRTQVDKEGRFSLSLPIEKTTQIQLHCEGAQGPMYADPGAHYKILLNNPDSTQKNAFVKKMRIDFDTLPIYDINNLILDFNSRHDDFIYYNFTLFGKPKFEDRLDTFKIYLSKVYKNVKHPYFLDYVAYSVAETEMMGPPRKDETGFLRYIYGRYLQNKPVQYGHDRYMSFFTKFYADMFKMVSVEDEMDMFRAINDRASPTLISRLLSKDALLRDKRISELAMLKSLQQEYYNYEFDKEMILTMLDSVAMHSKFEEHRLIAGNIKRRLVYLNNGATSPGFALLNQLDSLVTSDKFKGKFQYIMFWSVDNTVSVNELKLMKGLYDKYKWDIEFISINVDDNPKLMKDFLRKNPYKWTFLHYGRDREIRQRYNAIGIPQFYLVDPDGVLLQSPALRPSPDGTGRTIEKTFYTIQRKLHPNQKWLPGQKDNGGPAKENGPDTKATDGAPLRQDDLGSPTGNGKGKEKQRKINPKLAPDK